MGNAFFRHPAMFSYIYLVVMFSCRCICISYNSCYLFGKILLLPLLQTVTHPSTNRAERRVTSLIETNALTFVKD